MWKLVPTTVAAFLVLTACGGGSPDTTGTVPASASPGPGSVDRDVQATEGASTVSPAAPGTYTFQQTGTQLADPDLPDPGPLPETGILVVDPPEQTDDGLEQHSRRSDATGSFQDIVLLFGEDGVYLAEIEVRNETSQDVQQYRCEPDEPILFLPPTLGPGTTWSDSSDCGGVGALSYEAAVEGDEQVTLGDGSVAETVRIRQRTMLDSDEGSGTSEMTIWYSPDLHVQVRLDEKTQVQYSVYDLSRQQQDLLVSSMPS